jgi:hypothetical protein
MLPPYIEFVKKLPHFQTLSTNSLVETSLSLMRGHLQRIPEHNPFYAFKEKFARDLDWLMQAEIDIFHAYSFATLRQYGACYELVETYLRWLGRNNIAQLEAPTEAFAQISQTTKALQFQLARSMARKKPMDLSPLDTMAAHWQNGMDILMQRFG